MALPMWALYKPGRLDFCFLIALALYAAARLLSGSLLAELVTLLAVFVLASALAVKVIRHSAGKLLWRLRNRMIVLYLLIAVIPAVLLGKLVLEGARYLAGQIAVYMVHSELERRLSTMEGIARSVLRAPEANRSAMLDRIGLFYEERFPGLQVIIGDSQAGRDARGIVAKEGLLFAWASVSGSAGRVTVATPLSKKWLAGLSPGLGEVSIVHFPGGDIVPGQAPLRIRTHEAGSGPADDDEVPAVPPPASRFDVELLWGSKIPVALWDSPHKSVTALLAVHSRMSALMQILLSLKTESPIPTLLYVLAISLAALQLISFVLGVSMTRAVTDAVHNLYEGTERVMQGDFSHRIRVRGNEQIAELSRSFNRMTENLEHLVAVAKEKERMEAELEIARGVQQQLFPRQAPAIHGLELSALCKPARSVSGDYYDFQPLHDGRCALAIGDVAGKGISAALLMAMLQSSLRTRLHATAEMAAANGSAPLSTSSLVSRLNQQLHADTSPEKFATFFLSIYDQSTGLLTYTNAGHLQPLLIRGGSVIHCGVNGMIVGAFASASYDESLLQIEPGDLLVAYTDGITEPENEFAEMFGEARLIETVLKSSHMSLDQIIHTVMEEVHRFTGSGELQDDMTMLLARRTA